MKKIFLSILALATFGAANAQMSYKKSPSLGIAFGLYDFKTAADLRAKGLTGVLADKQYTKLSRMDPAMGISYMQGLSEKFDLSANLMAGFLKYPVPNEPTSLNDGFLLDLAVTGNLKLLSDKYVISPYLTTGVGVSKYKSSFAAYYPLGVGLQVNLKNEAYIQLVTQYRVPVTELANYHVYHGLSVVAPLKKKEIVPVVEAPKPVDTDGDGVIDADDKCPNVAGLAAMQGCPDTDNDGITDADDKCPTVAGIAALQGCPDKDGDGVTDAEDACPEVAGVASLQGCPDKDGDGIADAKDNCPDVAGLERYQGCPIPDTDKDGVNDEEDKCKTEAGPATNYGCPVIDEKVIAKINRAAENVFFATGSAKLLPKSFKPLNDVIAILKENPSFNLTIDGHTDNTGKADKNQTLSQNRAEAVKTYLVSKGIDASKLTATGYGDTKPRADNKTAKGRQQNRRVEMNAKNY